ncbi:MULTISPECIES: hypothetical protein [Paenibacillus]|uniref:hypothetical protein n=1 Tax=Paenibacillus TaxID=44249 RepID=UPI0009A6FFB0|nr:MULTISPECIES: hypothetical protein [Paenibacillus]MCZ1268219.1 hypothetical protein [Paenibacillus tundrae]SLK16486.1 hypothetical protein SAMN06272722_110175 [Paenibacillus sp. RU5A]SOC74389.1 hypothetical protein SAMN05880581_110175 [Paenibacillus sp. RU26A]SOC76527.1 hypothetical protein SAMN05880586_110175 [Paenibacillus sp. RU5M]
MRNIHWSVYCAVSYFILIFIINVCISTWASSEHARLTQGANSSGQAAPSIAQGVESLFDSMFEPLENTTANNGLNEIHINAEEIQKKSAQLVNTAKSALIYMLISIFASVLTTIALLFPKIVMDIIEKFTDLTDIDYDSLSKLKFVMVTANISILCWDVYGAVNIWKYF